MLLLFQKRHFVGIFITRKYHLISIKYHPKVSPTEMDKIKCNFYIEPSKTNSLGDSLIWIRSRHNSELLPNGTKRLIRKSTGLLCKPSDWDKKKKLPKDSHLKNQVTSIENEIDSIYKALSKKNLSVTLENCWDRFKSVDTDQVLPKSTRIVDWIDHYLKSTPYSPSYTRGVKLLRVHLTGKYTWKGKKWNKFESNSGFAPGLTFDQLTQTKVDALSRFMADNGKSTGTVLKVIKFLKQVAKMARDEGVKVGTLDFKAPKNFQRKSKTEVRLTFNEIHKILAVKLENENQKIVRDLFVLQCFTGLRHVDLMKLTPENIHGEFIHAKQQKTSSDVFITLNKYSDKILNGYLAKAEDNNGLLFPQLSQQYYNRALKQIGEAAKLKDSVKQIAYSGPNEIITEAPKYTFIQSHTGRRSFARLLSLLGLPEEIISDEMGHSTRNITAHYIGGLEHSQRVKIVRSAWNKAEKVFAERDALMRVA